MRQSYAERNGQKLRHSGQRTQRARQCCHQVHEGPASARGHSLGRRRAFHAGAQLSAALVRRPGICGASGRMPAFCGHLGGHAGAGGLPADGPVLLLLHRHRLLQICLDRLQMADQPLRGLLGNHVLGPVGRRSHRAAGAPGSGRGAAHDNSAAAHEIHGRRRLLETTFFRKIPIFF